MIPLESLKGFGFDLDGCIWAGPTLLPGARELVATTTVSAPRTASSADPAARTPNLSANVRAWRGLQTRTSRNPRTIRSASR